jgi:WD40 repeat protein
VATIAVSPDGSLIATGSRDDLVKIWRASTGELVRTFEGHSGWVEDVTFSSDGRLLATAAGDGTARVIEVATGREVLRLQHSVGVMSARFGAGDRTLVTADGDATPPDPTPIRVWDYPSGKLRMAIKADGTLRAMTLNRARTLVAAGFLDGTARVWELATGHIVATMRGHTASLFAVAFSPDGRRLASGSDNGEVKVWDVMSGANTLSLPGHGGPVGQVIFSPDGARLVTSGGDGKIRVWALDLDDLIAIAKRKVTRAFTPEECRLYLHQATC